MEKTIKKLKQTIMKSHHLIVLNKVRHYLAQDLIAETFHDDLVKLKDIYYMNGNRGRSHGCELVF